MSTYDEAYQSARSAIERLRLASDEDSDLSVEARLGHASSAGRWVRKAVKAFEDLVDSHSAAVANVAPGQTCIDDIPGVTDQRGSTVTVNGSRMVLTPADGGAAAEPELEPTAAAAEDAVDAAVEAAFPQATIGELDALTHIVLALEKAGAPCTVAQLAAVVGRPGSEVHRFLTELEEHRLVHQATPYIWRAGAAPEDVQETAGAARADDVAEPYAAVVRRMLEEKPGLSMTTTEIVAATRLTHSQVDEVCRTFVQLERVEKLGRGRWRWLPSMVVERDGEGRWAAVDTVGVSARQPEGVTP